ncbi:acetate--CoA ligase family protein [Cupriavidus basilensis]
MVPYRVCANAEEAMAAFAALGGKAVVVKGCAAEVPHKSEHGLVHLRADRCGRRGARAAQACLATLHSLGVENAPRVLVAAMVKGRHEFALGVSVDPAFGRS